MRALIIVEKVRPLRDSSTFTRKRILKLLHLLFPSLATGIGELINVSGSVKIVGNSIKKGNNLFQARSITVTQKKVHVGIHI